MKLHQAKNIVCNIIPNTFFSVEKQVWAYMNNIDYSRFNDISENPTAKQEQTVIEQGRRFIEEAKIICHPLDDAKVGDGMSFESNDTINAYTIVYKNEDTIKAQKDISTLQANGLYTHAANPNAPLDTFVRMIISDGDSPLEVCWIALGSKENVTRSAELGRKTVVHYPVAV